MSGDREPPLPQPSFGEALIAARPTPDYPDHLSTFGQLVGSWDLSNRFRTAPDTAWVESRRHWLFSYILDGRGVQDVLIGSDRTDDSGGESSETVFGTTVRIYDPFVGAWRVSYFGPHTGEYCSMIALGHRDGIRQDGTDTEGRPIRWNFSAITPDSFEWDGWLSDDDGATWWLQQHMVARRTA